MKIINWFPLIWAFDDARSDVNAQNSLFRIRLWTKAPRPAAVLAQEVFEIEYKWRRLGAYLMTVFSRERSRRFREEMELMGHAVEVAAAVRLYQADRSLQERAEAEALLNPDSSYAERGLFPAMSVEDVTIELESRREPARRWVQDNEERLQNWQWQMAERRQAVGTA